MNKIEVKIINRSMHDLPEYKTQGAAGLDIAAFLSEAISLAPMERKLIPTGIFLEIPLGFEVQIRPRSGLSIKQGLTVINAPGTIDSDYRGEVMVPLVNLSQEVQEVKNGDRIAQMILAKHEIIVWNEVQDLSETDRGVGGFGHTGK